jgi:hypothetical protein
MVENERASRAGGGAPRPAEELLTSCGSCAKLHAPAEALAFNPLCSGCAGTRPRAPSRGVAP